MKTFTKDLLKLKPKWNLNDNSLTSSKVNLQPEKVVCLHLSLKDVIRKTTQKVRNRMSMQKSLLRHIRQVVGLRKNTSDSSKLWRNMEKIGQKSCHMLAREIEAKWGHILSFCETRQPKTPNFQTLNLFFQCLESEQKIFVGNSKKWGKINKWKFFWKNSLFYYFSMKWNHFDV